MRKYRLIILALLTSLICFGCSDDGDVADDYIDPVSVTAFKTSMTLGKTNFNSKHATINAKTIFIGYTNVDFLHFIFLVLLQPVG